MGDSEFSLEQSNIQHRGTLDGASVAIALFARCLFQRRTEEHNVTEIGYFALFWLFCFHASGGCTACGSTTPQFRGCRICRSCRIGSIHIFDGLFRVPDIHVR
jgi:hypothetical protein